MPSHLVLLQLAEVFEYLPPDEPAVRILPSYEASEGERDSLGRLVFDDHPEFTLSLTPQQVCRAKDCRSLAKLLACHP